MRHLLPWTAGWGLLAGCSTGPNDETLIPDVRVVSVDATSPELNPGETVGLTATVADPLGKGVEMVAWSCTAFGLAGTPCLEAQANFGVGSPTPLLVAPDLVDEQASWELTASPALAAVFSEDLPELSVGVWTLACAPGLCPLIEDVRTALSTGEIDEALAADLADPDRWMADLPFRGVSLARRSVVVSLRPEEEQNHNPTIAVELPASVATEEEAEFAIQVVDNDPDPDEQLLAFPFTTAGGFAEAGLLLGADGSSTVAFYGAETAGIAKVYVLTDDNSGGTATWRGTIEVTP